MAWRDKSRQAGNIRWTRDDQFAVAGALKDALSALLRACHQVAGWNSGTIPLLTAYTRSGGKASSLMEPSPAIRGLIAPFSYASLKAIPKGSYFRNQRQRPFLGTEDPIGKGLRIDNGIDVHVTVCTMTSRRIARSATCSSSVRLHRSSNSIHGLARTRLTGTTLISNCMYNFSRTVTAGTLGGVRDQYYKYLLLS